MNGVNDIKTFKAISNGALKGAALPARLKVFGWGDNESTDGIFRAGDKTAATLSANQRRTGFERVAIDFNHCTVPGTDTHKELIAAGQPPLIFGYGRVNPIPGDGIYLEEITWTPLGQQHARNFEDLSPALADDKGEVTMIHSVGLTPNGKVTDLKFFSAATTNQNTPMPEKFISLSALAGALSLDVNADEAAVLAKLKTALTPATASAANAAPANPTAALAAELKELIKPLSAEISELKTKLTNAEKASTDAAAETVIKSFSADGKVPKKADGTAYSAEELKKLDLPTLQILAANTPVTVALSARGGTRPADSQKKYRDAKGVVDLAALFEDENKRTGLSLTPPAAIPANVN